jgi:hypothetical protein
MSKEARCSLLCLKKLVSIPYCSIATACHEGQDPGGTGDGGLLGQIVSVKMVPLSVYLSTCLSVCLSSHPKQERSLTREDMDQMSAWVLVCLSVCPSATPPPSGHSTWFRPSQSHASAMSFVLRSTGSSEIISTSGGSTSGVPVGTPAPSVIRPASAPPTHASAAAMRGQRFSEPLLAFHSSQPWGRSGN